MNEDPEAVPLVAPRRRKRRTALPGPPPESAAATGTVGDQPGGTVPATPGVVRTKRTGRPMRMPPPPEEGPRAAAACARQVPFEELLHRFRQAEETVHHRRVKAASQGPGNLATPASGSAAPLAQQQLLAMEEMQRAMRDIIDRHDELERRAEEAEAALARAEERLSTEADARQSLELLRSEAERRVQELELVGLDFQAERERWKQREAELADEASQGYSMSRDRETKDRFVIEAKEKHVRELEALLRQAILRGAKLGRAKADAESASAGHRRRLERLGEKSKAKLRRERRRLGSLLAAAQDRAERAEDRLMDYLEASCEGADALAERHMEHLIEVSHGLAQRVEEQAEIINALRGLLHDHKEFIRREFWDILQLPPPSLAAPPTSAAAASAMCLPPPRADPTPTPALLELLARERPPSPPVAEEQQRDLGGMRMDPPDLHSQQPETPDLSEFMDLTAALETTGQHVQANARGAEGSSTDSFDDEIFGPSTGDAMVQQVMPGGAPNTARARRRTSDVASFFDDEWT